MMVANEKRLIDANALRQMFDEREADDVELYGGVHIVECFPADDAKEIVDQMPTVDAVEVVHGRWIKYKDEKFIGYDADGRIKYRNVYYYNCDKCGHGTAAKSNYCPACGAKMEGVKEVGY